MNQNFYNNSIRHKIKSFFIDPLMKRPLIHDVEKGFLIINDEEGYIIKDNVINFYEKIKINSLDQNLTSNHPSNASCDTAPELRLIHEKLFRGE